jgi:adenosylcobinamide kinase / adenosylcobinamide-phosphate guanylyltransferase
MANIVLILGGARSGKSRFAQQLAQQLSGDDVLFVATAEAGDEEMSRRIHVHQTTRPATWPTLEAAFDVGSAIQSAAPRQQTLLIDCLTLLVSNVLLKHADAGPVLAGQCVESEIDKLLTVCNAHPGNVILVSGEVGLGLVPETPLGRWYRDLLGTANQSVAARSNATYLVIAGLPVELKSLAVTTCLPTPSLRGEG